jgi:AmmeMemoRadiSam system protein B
MRQSGGMLVSHDEVESILADLDESCLLESARYRAAKDRIVSDFLSEKTRKSYLCGRGYPEEAAKLGQVIDDILKSAETRFQHEGKIKALVAPHIDLSVGSRVYASAYAGLKNEHTSRVILLGTGHSMSEGMFCLTEKDFETPLGIVKNDSDTIQRLKTAGSDIIAANDISHRAEHSLEFQLLFLQYLLGTDSFCIIPILCGPLMTTLPSYDREAYLKTAGGFLEELKEVVLEGDQALIIVAGVDLSHIGLKFGHSQPAKYLAADVKEHDHSLLNALSEAQPELLWEESARIHDRYNVCGFSSLACLLEILPTCRGKALDYQMWFEDSTQSAVSFAAAIFAT